MNITLERAIKDYNGIQVLDIDKLEFKEGNIYVILGSNGSGKSTLINCISGLDNLSKGNIYYDGVNLSSTFRNEISLMVQKPYLFNTTAMGNIISGLKFRKINKEEINRRIEKYMSYFDVNDLLNKKSNWLSGGERAKIALLRTAVLQTKITLLDEPTSSMDIESSMKAENLIKELSCSGRTSIVVTHDVYQARRIADYIIFMDKGKIIEKGHKEKVLMNPQNNLVKQILNI